MGDGLASLLADIEKKHGSGSILCLGDDANHLDDVISTGAIFLDEALGVGGIPRGRITEIIGAESSGKTTLVQAIIASAHRMGGKAAIIDTEHALDAEYAAKCGCDLKRLYICQPSYGEQAFDIMESLIRSGEFMVVALDSVASLVPRAELEGEMGEMQVGGMARLMSHGLRKLTGAISKSNTAVIFTNQIREKIGVMYGSNETTPGGRALRHHASIRIDVRRGEVSKRGDVAVGAVTKVRVVKNKLAPPLRTAEFDIIFGEGISREGGLLEMGAQKGIVRKAGAFYSFGETRLGQGRDNAREFLRTNPSMANEIERLIREKK